MSDELKSAVRSEILNRSLPFLFGGVALFQTALPAVFRRLSDVGLEQGEFESLLRLFFLAYSVLPLVLIALYAGNRELSLNWPFLVVFLAALSAVSFLLTMYQRPLWYLALWFVLVFFLSGYTLRGIVARIRSAQTSAGRGSLASLLGEGGSFVSGSLLLLATGLVACLTYQQLVASNSSTLTCQGVGGNASAPSVRKPSAFCIYLNARPLLSPVAPELVSTVSIDSIHQDPVMQRLIAHSVPDSLSRRNLRAQWRDSANSAYVRDTTLRAFGRPMDAGCANVETNWIQAKKRAIGVQVFLGNYHPSGQQSRIRQDSVNELNSLQKTLVQLDGALNACAERLALRGPEQQRYDGAIRAQLALVRSEAAGDWSSMLGSLRHIGLWSNLLAISLLLIGLVTVSWGQNYIREATMRARIVTAILVLSTLTVPMLAKFRPSDIPLDNLDRLFTFPQWNLVKSATADSPEKPNRRTTPDSIPGGGIPGGVTDLTVIRNSIDSIVGRRLGKLETTLTTEIKKDNLNNSSQIRSIFR